MAKGAVHDVKDYGIVCDLEVNPDVVGLAATHQVGFQDLKAQCAFAAASGALQRHVAPNLRCDEASSEYPGSCSEPTLQLASIVQLRGGFRECKVEPAAHFCA